MKKTIFKNGILVIIVVLGFIYHHQTINEFPSHIHAWAQSDRYAISLGFVDNNLNFFKPQTFVYNHQFPNDWEVPIDETITAVDFPIHDYIPALFMKAINNNSPWIFRLYILLYSFLGLYFLFKLSMLITSNYSKSIFAVIFAATSPVFVYYQGGFLPTIPSLSNAIIGVYFYYRYIKEDRIKDFWISLLFFTLAALSRTTFAIPIIAVLGVEFLRFLKKETKITSKIFPIIISLFVLISYFFYNNYLRDNYGSLFLNHLMLPDSIEQSKEILKYIFQTWTYSYFSKYHYLVFASICLLLLFVITKKTRSFHGKGYFFILIATYFFGCIFFSFLMLKQFTAHDYYFLDTYFLPINLFLILLLSLIPDFKNEILKYASFVFLFFVCFILILQPINSQKSRRETGFWDKTGATISNFTGSSVFLDSLEIPKTSKILVIDAVAPNIPFILMQRKGFAVMKPTKENIQESLNWNYDYIAFQNENFISIIYSNYPEILYKLAKIGDNGKISICKYSKNNHQSLKEFMGLNNDNIVLGKSVNFENDSVEIWENYKTTNKYAYTGAFSGFIDARDLYGLTFKIKNLPALKTNSRSLFFSSYFLKKTIINCEIVVSIYSGDESLYYKSYNINNLVAENNQWEKVSLLFQLPIIQTDDYEFAIFILNTGQNELYFDDFEFSLY